MKKSNSVSFSDDEQIVQRLNFTTPEKRVNDWQLPADSYARRLFESVKKVGDTQQNIILVMPLIEEGGPKKSSASLISSIHSLLNE